MATTSQTKKRTGLGRELGKVKGQSLQALESVEIVVDRLLRKLRAEDADAVLTSADMADLENVRAGLSKVLMLQKFAAGLKLGASLTQHHD